MNHTSNHRIGEKFILSNVINRITLHGRIRTVQKSSVSSNGKPYWQFFINVERQSGHVDTLPVIVLSDVLRGLNLKPDIEITVVGAICTKSSSNNRKESHLQVYVYAFEIIQATGPDENEVVLEGKILRNPIYRETKTGVKICDLMIQAATNSSIPIPCLVWDERAQIAASHNAGDRIRIRGMLQRRVFRKSTANGQAQRFYYEVSAYRSEFD